MAPSQVLSVPGKFSEKNRKAGAVPVSHSIFVFGPFRLDPQEGVLRRSGKPVPLFPKAVELLAALLAARGSVVRKEQLLESVWPGTFVQDGTLSKNISFLRKALGSRRYIETSSRRGYRFAGPFQELPGQEARPPLAVNSVAMLPFRSADEKLDYIGEGLTDSLIALLSRLSDLKVMASSTVFQFRGNNVDPRQVAQELGVDAVLCGRLTGRARRLELSVELCDKKGTRLWGQTYQRSRAELPAWDHELARDIASALERSWTPTAAATSSPKDAISKAYHLYLKGLHEYNKRTPAAILKSGEFFQRALEADPHLALAHVGVGMAYSTLSWVWVGTLAPADVRPAMETATSKALELDPALPEAYVMRGSYLFWHEWKWRAAEQALLRAVGLNPQCVMARQVYGFLLTALGRLEEAEEQLVAALELDPLSNAININLAWLWYVAGRYDKAIEMCEETVELEPGFGGAHLVLGLCHERKKQYAHALADLDRARQQVGENSTVIAVRAFILGKLGRRAEAVAALKELEIASKSRYVSAFIIGLGYCGIPDTTKALAWLEKALDERSFGLLLIHNLPIAEAVGTQPQFRKLLRGMGL
jgi:adenylate cyclase